jgi:hypothetical protein
MKMLLVTRHGLAGLPHAMKTPPPCLLPPGEEDILFVRPIPPPLETVS